MMNVSLTRKVFETFSKPFFLGVWGINILDYPGVLNLDLLLSNINGNCNKMLPWFLW